MSAAETKHEEKEEGRNTASPPVSGRPTKTLFSLMEDEAGGATPEPSYLADYNQEFVYNEISPKDYNSSNFPSLMSHLGPKAKHRTISNLKKRQDQQTLPTEDEHGDGKGKPKRHKQKLTFMEEMRRRNEARWMRIEAVAKEKMDYYERYVSDMTLKIKQQRTKINQRAEQLLKSLEKQEAQAPFQTLHKSQEAKD
ncbi:uncharacterized protein LOC123531929 isoform X2 [Mercenaria mercenaria]|uniref:uncharacterized protein LOC123531929 isoform X2 n=1 Tax=Mercenaria mercenaria TaxID=6596 RepID=UPI00234F2CFC|nr:uncharacterized protein LOC123531929 isoform X2 [Mercenaria mercenaria]